ncbi:cell division cycle and apoptosis regulator protein 1-like isoform X1 [Anastrepha obliqua]|uniref:cell division cycle and apoptosis regulator protein 1-like isoform X1 n=1 Tax=Anastrepha obliqua TaxID=95512 RepID=UPI002409A54A|nr:cell division cycle and apoptosis regulator protein 1-like isoform X1 [Anastrepha obliqua]
MSFGGQQNQPWQRKGGFYQDAGQGGMFMQQHAASQSAFGHSAIFSQSGAAPSVSYPQQRSNTLNPVAFQQPNNGGQTMTNSIGTVTKINNDCGLINDEVFFYRNACKGVIPKLGDRVVFEATYSTTGQFKWNATLIQLMGSTMTHQTQHLPSLMGNSGRAGSGYNAVPPPNEYQLAQMQQRRRSPRHSSPMRGDRSNVRNDRERDRRGRNPLSREREDDERDRKRRRADSDRSRERAISSIGRGHERDRARPEGKPDTALERRERDREREREREKERERDRERERERERDKERGERAERSPYRPPVKGRRTRAIRRYMIQIPKNILAYKSADLQELRQRYSTLYIPSDFFHANILWPKVFTPENAFSLRRPCRFHIMHRIVDSPFEQNNDVLEPSDADYLYSAKVMLLACPPITELYQKCFEEDDNDNEQNAVHPSRLISFLVGTRGRNEPMAIGGPWSPSLDGENPDKDPAVLIRTAIRTCKALTGIDLSQCTQWYRFVELHYHRQDHKKKDAQPRIETVVIYLPDVHSCMPNSTQWQELTQVYKNAVEGVIARKNAAAKAAAANTAAVDAEMAASSPTAADGDAADTSATDATKEEPDKTTGDESVTTNNESGAETTSNGVGENAADREAEDGADTSMEVITIEEVEISADGDNNDDQKDDQTEATHYSKLDLKSMKVQEIRDELAARDLNAKGARNIIMARLAKALNTEKAEDKETKKTEPKTKQAKNQPKPVKKPETVTKKTDSKSEETAEAEENDKPKEEEQEDQEEWNDVIDVDMSDIVILDEYDSSKNPEETPKELNEKEKNQLIRRYKLPTKEHIVVHPNKTAKGGKFDCSIMSLSVLLDYGPADTKERFFEVSIFAELFNEMLMRDFAFNIYKEMYLYKEENNASKDAAKDKKEGDTNGEGKTDAETMEVDEESKASTDTKTNADSAGDKTISERRASKRSVDVEADTETPSKNANERKQKSATGKDKEKEKEKEHVSDRKMIVVKPQLLLSFIYFDTTHCGYIFEKDLEDLFTVLGLNLSRGQIRKVLGKLSIRQAFYYRKLTDKEESVEAPPKIEDADDIPSEELNKIALGNNVYIPNENELSGGGGVVERATSSKTDANDSDGLVNYKGIVIHVGKLLEQIKRTEKNYGDLEKLYNDLRKQHTELHRDHTKANTKSKDLQSEVKTLSRKLSDANQDLFALNRKYRDQHNTLSTIYNRVAPYFNREKDKDHKSDKDADKDKDKDKDKDAKDKPKEAAKSSKDKEKEKDKDKEKEKTKEKEKEKNKDKEKTKETGKDVEKSSGDKGAKDKNEESKAIVIKEESKETVIKEEEFLAEEDEADGDEEEEEEVEETNED